MTNNEQRTMPDRDEILKLFMLDDPDPEAWEKMFAALTDAERMAYVRRVHEALAADPDAFPEVPPDVIDQMGESADKYQRADRAARIAEQNLALAKAKLEKTIDTLLSGPPDEQTKGH